MQVPVAGDHNAGRAEFGLVAAHGFEFAGFDDAQQIGLLFQGEGVDFVEQNGSIARRREFADFGTVGSGEGPFDVAKEFTFDEVGGRAPQGTTKNRSAFRGEQS